MNTFKINSKTIKGLKSLSLRKIAAIKENEQNHLFVLAHSSDILELHPTTFKILGRSAI